MVAGIAVAAAAYAGRYGIQAWQVYKARPPTVRLRKFYEGGFQPKMTRREAALILGVRYMTFFTSCLEIMFIFVACDQILLFNAGFFLC